MQTHDTTSVLPLELLHAIFDSFNIAQLARLKRVNTRWRDAVTTYPMYWSHPQLRSSSPAETTFFLARLGAATGKPFCISLNIRERFVGLQTTVFPAMVPHLAYVTKLVLCVHIRHAPAAFEVLRSSTPSLQYLQLEFGVIDGDIDDWDVPVMPDDILREGCVETLSLYNIDLSRTVSSALASTRSLVYGHSFQHTETTLRALIGAFPNAKEITLVEGGVPSGGAALWPAEWQSLPSLTLLGASGRVEAAIAHIALDSVSHLAIEGTSHRPTFARLLSHLEGPLNLSCESKRGGRYAIHIRSSVRGRVRSFHGVRPERLFPSIQAAFPHHVLDAPTLAPRIRSLDISSALWNYLVSFMPYFEDLACVTIVLSRTAGLAQMCQGDTQRIIGCPRLRELHLSAPFGQQDVTAADVKYFILRCLRPTPPASLQLVLRGVRLPPEASLELYDVVSSISELEYENMYPASSSRLESVGEVPETRRTRTRRPRRPLLSIIG
ncbi:hypothetical protein AURDEDRAFT_172744 [Auricularia subglabra TFB-10046 SS5]|nr:hypothetical protein AURDEDRAFT_172744 [Auricularia subglabra TFB-10046 SS5]